MARRFLGAPIGSVASEREFSIAGHVITDTRGRLLPANAEMLIWLYYNVRAIDYDVDRVVQEYEAHMLANEKCDD